jgi:hypothetical protein
MNLDRLSTRSRWRLTSIPSGSSGNEATAAALCLTRPSLSSVVVRESRGVGGSLPISRRGCSTGPRRASYFGQRFGSPAPLVAVVAHRALDVAGEPPSSASSRLYKDWSSVEALSGTSDVLRRRAHVLHTLWAHGDQSSSTDPRGISPSVTEVVSKLGRKPRQQMEPIGGTDVAGEESLPRMTTSWLLADLVRDECHVRAGSSSAG